MITSGSIDYDSKLSICLDSGFEINASSNIEIIIVGCDIGAREIM